MCWVQILYVMDLPDLMVDVDTNSLIVNVQLVYAVIQMDIALNHVQVDLNVYCNLIHV